MKNKMYKKINRKINNFKIIKFNNYKNKIIKYKSRIKNIKMKQEYQLKKRLNNYNKCIQKLKMIIRINKNNK